MRPTSTDSGWKRLAWFVGIALASSALTMLVAYGLKALLR